MAYKFQYIYHFLKFTFISQCEPKLLVQKQLKNEDKKLWSIRAISLHVELINIVIHIGGNVLGEKMYS
jgi:hypothetical protein